jgi:hypothetical protein
MKENTKNGITLMIALFFLFAYAPDEAILIEQPNNGGENGGGTNGGGTTEVYGCTDPTANNYDSTATVDDGSCSYDPNDVYGCTDPEANNYDSTATVDDGSCTYDSNDIYGCTDPNANNYDSTATVDDGSCNYDVYGCTDPNANNYDSTATVDDGSCNYDVYGCTDPNADNYDPAANVDDGSCVYPPPQPECSDGFENEGDGWVDSEDPECFFNDPVEGMIYCPAWNSESFPPANRQECDQGF